MNIDRLMMWTLDLCIGILVLVVGLVVLLALLTIVREVGIWTPVVTLLIAVAVYGAYRIGRWIRISTYDG